MNRIMSAKMFALLGVVALSGCAGVQEQINATIKDINQITSPTRPASNSDQTIAQSSTLQTAPAMQQPGCTATPISDTKLGGLFSKHPYDGTSKTHYPRVAVTVLDWSRSDCWEAKAKIWWSAKRSENVGPFSVGVADSFGAAVNGAVNYQLFMKQMTAEGTGNVRTDGPKAPMMAYPMPDPFGAARYAKSQQSTGFIRQMVAATGWQAGAPTNFWIVRFDQNATPSAQSHTETPAKKVATGKAHQLLQAFQRCDAAALKGQSGEVAPGLKVLRVKNGHDGINPYTQLVFNQRSEQMHVLVSQKTGYDFTNIHAENAKKGDVVFGYNEAAVDNYLQCNIQG